MDVNTRGPNFDFAGLIQYSINDSQCKTFPRSFGFKNSIRWGVGPRGDTKSSAPKTKSQSSGLHVAFAVCWESSSLWPKVKYDYKPSIGF